MGHGGWRNWQKNYVLELNKNKRKQGIFLTSLYEVTLGVKWDRNATNQLTHHGTRCWEKNKTRSLPLRITLHIKDTVWMELRGKKKELDDGLEMLLQNLSKEMRTWIGQKENGYIISSQAWRWGWKHKERHASKKMITTCTVTTGDLTSTKDTNGKRGNKLYRGLGGDVDGNEYWWEKFELITVRT